MMQMLQLRFRYSLLAFFLFGFLSILGCDMEDTRKIYRSDEVRIRVVNDDVSNKAYVIFSTLMETQFYSPGVKITTDEENAVLVEFARVAIQDKSFQVDLKAEYLTKWLKDQNLPRSIQEKIQNQSTSADQIFILPGKTSGIYVMDGVTKKLLWSR
jgi:hypothetical protein